MYTPVFNRALSRPQNSVCEPLLTVLSQTSPIQQSHVHHLPLPCSSGRMYPPHTQCPGDPSFTPIFPRCLVSYQVLSFSCLKATQIGCI